MKDLSLEEVIATWLETPRVAIRIPKGPDDWGDPATVHLQLKRQGATCTSPWDHFGTYYGEHPIGFVVAIKDPLGYPTRGEAFETLDEMKSRWQLD